MDKTTSIINFIEKSAKNAVSSKTVKDKINLYISTHVLVYKEDDFYIAHALEFDIVVDGKSEKDVKKDIKTSVFEYIMFALSRGTIEKVVNPAPFEFWERFYNNRIAGHKKSLKPSEFKSPGLPYSKGIFKEFQYATATC